MNFPKKQLRFFIIICFISLNLGAQVPTSTFRTHLNYEVARGVSVSQNYVYVNTENGFYRKSKSNDQSELLDKRNGLSEMNVTTSAYQIADNQLLIGYESGAIDVVNLGVNDEFENVSTIDFIKNATGISQSKRINKIVTFNNQAYVATAFGLVEINLANRRVQETYRNIGPNGIPVSVNDIVIQNDSLFLSTSVGVLAGSLSPSVNLLFFGNWKLVTNSTLFQFPKLPSDVPLITKINDVKNEGDIFWVADESSGLVTNSSGNWQSIIPDGLPETTGYFFIENERVGFVGNEGHIFNENKWSEITQPFPAKENIIIDRFENRWELLNGTLRVTSNGRIFNFSQFNGLSGQPTDIALDRDDLLWISTTNGITVIPTTNDFANNPVDPFTPVFGNQRLLLQQIVNTVEIDGGNRKWFGTNSGLFCFSPDTDELINFFNSENSLLLDNQISDLKINATGELFILTQNGVISYQTDAAEPEETLNNITLFPNPIRPDFESFFTVKGLSFDSKIKITTPDGRVVSTTFSNGGIATWNLLTLNGDKAPSGVYFVFVLNSDLTEKFVGKVAVVR